MIHLHYEEKGQGQPLILLHGNGEDSSYFCRQTEYFQKSRRVFAVDTRGHGRSPRGTAPFTIRQFAEDLRDFMEERQIGRADILGFSDGGNIALVFALRYPEKTGRLILNGANLYFRGMERSVQASVLLEYLTSSLAGRFSKKAASRAELARLMVKDPAIDPGDLAGIRSRTLVIAGDRDMIKESHTRLIASKIPGARLCILPGSHFVAAENPDLFNEVVEKFLKKE